MLKEFVIGEVGAIIDGLLSHLPLFAACAIIDEELLSMVGRWYPYERAKAGPL